MVLGATEAAFEDLEGSLISGHGSLYCRDHHNLRQRGAAMSEYSAGPSGLVSLPSTTFEWKRVILAESSAPAGEQRSRSEHIPAVRARDSYRPLNVDVQYRGGPEASFTIRYRGRTWRFPGCVQLIDVIRFINGQT